ncbi:MAG TPA: HD-GYP domain-containing protein [Bacilli bacterium]|nr:HD-GYP domain-containing protein [Bacilli bacterium]
MLTFLLFAILTYWAYYQVYFVTVGESDMIREDAHILLWCAAVVVGGAPLLAFALVCYMITYSIERLRHGYRYRPSNLLLLVLQAGTIHQAYVLLHDLLGADEVLGTIVTMFGTVLVTQVLTVLFLSVVFRVPVRSGGWKRQLLKYNLMDSIYLSLYVISTQFIVSMQAEPWWHYTAQGVITLAILGLYYWRTVGIKQTQVVGLQLDEMQELNAEITYANQQVLLAFASSLEKRDPYTAGHSERVARYAQTIARELGLSEHDQEVIHLGGLLHDIGKIGIPDSVLNKPGRLTAEEYDVMKQHPVLGEELLRRVYTQSKILPEADRERMLEIVLYHHERPDGRGYPYGLQGEDIPLFARLTAVADAYDAMTSNRAYRDAMSLDKAASILLDGRGTQFWPPAVDAFVRTLPFEAEAPLDEVAAAAEPTSAPTE